MTAGWSGWVNARVPGYTPVTLGARVPVRQAVRSWACGPVRRVSRIAYRPGRAELPALPAGPGTYRLRYHGRNVDAGRAADTADEPVDEYLLQIWPAPP